MYYNKHMPSAKRKTETITFPLSVFETTDSKEDLEDWLLSQRPEFIKKCVRQDMTMYMEKAEIGNPLRSMYQIIFLPDAEDSFKKLNKPIQR